MHFLILQGLCDRLPTIGSYLANETDVTLAKAWSKNVQTDILITSNFLNMTLFVVVDSNIARDIAEFSKFMQVDSVAKLKLLS